MILNYLNISEFTSVLFLALFIIFCFSICHYLLLVFILCSDFKLFQIVLVMFSYMFLSFLFLFKYYVFY